MGKIPKSIFAVAVFGIAIVFTAQPALAAKPNAPTNLSATAASQTQINLSWTDNSSNETGFKIERGTDGISFSQIATVGANVTTYQNTTGLSANTTYYYRVRAYNSQNSNYSNAASATTLPNPPSAPTNLNSSVISQTQINLSWTDNASNETGFKIERSTDGTNYNQIDTVGVNMNSYQNTGLTANTLYYYRVRAYNTGGNSGYSNVRYATTWKNIPADPTDLSATAMAYNQINLAWSDNATNEETYFIERSLDGTNFSFISTTSPNATSFYNTGLNSNTTYYYRVRAYNNGGYSNYTNNASAATFLNLPAAPTNLNATFYGGTSTLIYLYWTDNASNESGFKIERSDNGIDFSQIGTSGVNASGYFDWGLSVGTYYYRVRAYNNDGNSDYSNVDYDTIY
jgi:hypothetical protein